MSKLTFFQIDSAQDYGDSRESVKHFTFDYSYCSADPSSKKYASQELVRYLFSYFREISIVLTRRFIPVSPTIFLLRLFPVLPISCFAYFLFCLFPLLPISSFAYFLFCLFPILPISSFAYFLFCLFPLLPISSFAYFLFCLFPLLPISSFVYFLFCLFPLLPISTFAYFLFCLFPPSPVFRLFVATSM
jgi:hypothetical protein